MSAALFVMFLALLLFYHEAIGVRMEPARYNKVIAATALKYDVDPDLVRAVIYTESKFDQFDVGEAGEVGLMQILPGGAAADYAKSNKLKPFTRSELFDAKLNIEIGVWFLAAGLKRYADSPDAVMLALCRYNAGDSRAKRWAAAEGNLIDNIDIASTKAYVQKVLNRYKLYEDLGIDEK